MSEQKLVVVLGATGSQGGAVARILSQSSNYRVRVITRNPESLAAVALATAGMEVTPADLSSVSSLKAAFAGAYAIFAITDFWGIPPPFSEAGALEIQHGKNAAVAAAQTEGLQHYLWSSLPSPKKRSDGKYAGVLHFEGKLVVEEWIEKKLPRLWGITTRVIVGSYYENWIKFGKLRGPQYNAEDQTWEYITTLNPETVPPNVFSGDVGPLVYRILESPESYKGKKINLLGPKTSMAEKLETWGKHVGRKTRLHVIADQEYLELNLHQGLHPLLAKDLMENWAAFREFEDLYGGNDVLEGRKVLEDGGQQATSWHEWVRETDWTGFLAEQENAA